eukprot:160356-Pyramimonas_sp.AAC.1
MRTTLNLHPTLCARLTGGVTSSLMHAGRRHGGRASKRATDWVRRRLWVHESAAVKVPESPTNAGVHQKHKKTILAQEVRMKQQNKLK